MYHIFRKWTGFILSGLKCVDCRGRLWCKLKYFVRRAFTIGILPAYTRYRLVGKVHPPLVSNVEQVARAGQLHLRKGNIINRQLK